MVMILFRCKLNLTTAEQHKIKLDLKNVVK